MARIVFYGDNPYSRGANAYLNRSILNQVIDKNKVICLCYNAFYASRLFDYEDVYNIISVGTKEDAIGIGELINFLGSGNYDIFLSNNDIWRLWEVYRNKNILHEKSGFKWIQIFPCDSDKLKSDWIQVLNSTDLPIVYSKHGYDLYSPYVPNLKYFKPFIDPKVFCPLPDKKEVKKSLFGNDELFVIGVVARNQVRKDIIRTLQIFKVFSEKNKNSILYLHMESNDRFGSNLKEDAIRLGIHNKVAFKKPAVEVSPANLNRLYNGIDVLMVTSLGEGCCLPIIEAQLAGTPVIGSNNTSITELLSQDKGFLIDFDAESISMPIMERGGVTHEQRRRVNIEQGVAYLNLVYEKRFSSSILERARANALTYGKKDSFIEIASSFIDGVEKKKAIVPKRKDKILFMQHSSAGDVLITTGCFKGIKEKHPDCEMDYMTSEQFSDILVGNEYISEIVEWDKSFSKQYKKVYWPHERIRTGNWGSQDIPLWAMYSLLCDVEFDKMFIEQKEIERPDVVKIVKLLKMTRYITLNNMGGHPYRFYPWMSEIVKNIRGINFVQIGGKNDVPIDGALNLAGKLSYRESATIVAGSMFHIGVDSFCSHLAAAVDKLQICIYGSGARRVVKPKGITIDIQPNYILTCPILGPCWGNKADCAAPCIKSLVAERFIPLANLIIDGFGKGLSHEDIVKEVKDSFNG